MGAKRQYETRNTSEPLKPELNEPLRVREMREPQPGGANQELKGGVASQLMPLAQMTWLMSTRPLSESHQQEEPHGVPHPFPGLGTTSRRSLGVAPLLKEVLMSPPSEYTQP